VKKLVPCVAFVAVGVYAAVAWSQDSDDRARALAQSLKESAERDALSKGTWTILFSPRVERSTYLLNTATGEVLLALEDAKTGTLFWREMHREHFGGDKWIDEPDREGQEGEAGKEPPKKEPTRKPKQPGDK